MHRALLTDLEFQRVYMKFTLPDIAIRRPITVVMVVLTVLSFGAISFTRIPLEFLSLADVPVLSCYIPWPGAAPEEVEKEIAIPSEGLFKTVPNLKHINSYSSANGCFISMQFEWGTVMPTVTAEVRDRIERLRLQLPNDVDRLYLYRRGQVEQFIMLFALFRGDDREEIGRLARKYIQPRLERIDGVTEVEVHGGDYGVVYIEFDPNALKSANVGLLEVVGGIQQSNLNLSLGRLRDGDLHHYVRVVGEHRRLQDLEELIIGPSGTRLRDVANVSFRAPSMEHTFRMNGQHGVFVSVRKESQANTVATCDRINEALAEIMKEPQFKGVEFQAFHDQSKLIRSTLNALADAGKVGGLLALIVLFVFLRRVRATIIVTLAIPASLVVAFIAMYFMKISFNIVTMSAMIVSVGMLLDNSIVVMENIRRHQAFDPDPYSSARNGTLEVGLAITTATLTTMVVFLPVLFIQQGELSIYMRQFAFPMGVALMSSLVLALTVIPLAASRIFRRETGPGWVQRHGTGRFKTGGDRRLVRAMDRAKEVYPWVLGLVLRYRLAGLLLLVGLGAATYLVPFPRVGMQHMPDMDMRRVTISVSFERNSKDLAERTFQLLEEKLEQWRDELGIENVYISHSYWGGIIEAFLVDTQKLSGSETPNHTTARQIPYKRSTEEVRKIFAERLPERLPGTELHFGIPSAGTNETQKVTMSLRGADTGMVVSYAERFAEMLKTLPDVVDVTTSRENDETEIRLNVDEALASASGISPVLVARTVDFALRGSFVERMKLDHREVNVRAQFREEDRESTEDLWNVPIAVPSPARQNPYERSVELVPVSRLVSSTKGRAAKSLRRQDGRSVVTVTAEVETEDMLAVQRGIESLKKGFAMPNNYSIEKGHMFEGMATSQLAFRSIFIMAMLLSYLLMAALFESFLLPLSILTTVPLAFIGVYWCMWITDTPLDTVALIGAMVMCGIIVNNGIVIIDHINQLRHPARQIPYERGKHGMSQREAIIQAGRDRLRPVMMTAITTIFGCVPLAVGTGSYFDLLYSMGRVLVGGLTMGTVLTLFVVPIFYSLIDDLQTWVINYLACMARVSSTF